MYNEKSNPGAAGGGCFITLLAVGYLLYLMLYTSPEDTKTQQEGALRDSIERLNYDYDIDSLIGTMSYIGYSSGESLSRQGKCFFLTKISRGYEWNKKLSFYRGTGLDSLIAHRSQNFKYIIVCSSRSKGNTEYVEVLYVDSKTHGIVYSEDVVGGTKNVFSATRRTRAHVFYSVSENDLAERITQKLRPHDNY